MLIWNPAYERREAEANQFASYLLMPIDDYRRQVDDRVIDLNLFSFSDYRRQVDDRSIDLSLSASAPTGTACL